MYRAQVAAAAEAARAVVDTCGVCAVLKEVSPKWSRGGKVGWRPRVGADDSEVTNQLPRFVDLLDVRKLQLLVLLLRLLHFLASICAVRVLQWEGVCGVFTLAWMRICVCW